MENVTVNVALPKGRLGEKVYALFEGGGIGDERKLVFENERDAMRYFWVKPSDVPIYVERGAADIGVCGKDVLLEYAPDVYELLDLGFGVCRIAVASRPDFRDDTSRPLRVATKYPEIAKEHFRNSGREVDIIRLNGSIEIAPVIGLSDVIVDIVETGNTLRENGLTVIEDVVNISARLIANKAIYKFKYGRICAIRDALSAFGETK